MRYTVISTLAIAVITFAFAVQTTATVAPPPPSGSARLIQTSEAFPSAAAPDRLVVSAIPLQSSPAPGTHTFSGKGFPLI